MQKIYMPKVISGVGCLSTVGEKALECHATNALIITDSFMVKTPFFHQITESLSQSGVFWNVCSDVRPNPRTSDCDRVAKYAKEKKIDLLIGFGGGSSMDQAKAVAALLTNGKHCVDWDDVPLLRPMIPTICIPTTAGTGSETTFVAVITDENREYKMSLFDPQNLLPAYAICDPRVTASLPQPLTAACGIDALTHAIEAYTSRSCSLTTDALALRAVSLISRNLLRAYHHGNDLDAREQVMKGSTLAGISFINSNVGAVHSIAETIGARYDIPHGVANAIFLPYIMEFNLPEAKDEYADIAIAMGLSDTSKKHLAEHSILFIKYLCSTMKIPKLKDLSQISPDDFPLIAKRAADNPLSAENIRTITETDYLEILYKAYEQ